MVIVNKSISTDFGGNFLASQFQEEIVANGTFTAVIQSISTSGDNIDLVFDIALTGGENTTLTTLIGNHVPLALLTPHSVAINETSTPDTTFDVVYTHIFEGSDFISGGSVSKLQVVSRMDSGLTNYSVRIIDTTNANVIASGTFTNTSDSINNLGTVSNISINQAIWEIQMKVTGGTGSEECHIKDMQISTS